MLYMIVPSICNYGVFKKRETICWSSFNIKKLQCYFDKIFLDVFSVWKNTIFFLLKIFTNLLTILWNIWYSHSEISKGKYTLCFTMLFDQNMGDTITIIMANQQSKQTIQPILDSLKFFLVREAFLLDTT